MLNQSSEEREEVAEEICNGGGNHVWMHSTFCDKCDLSFDDWKYEIRRRVAFDLVAIELNKVLDEMWKEKRISRDNSTKLYNRMVKKTEDIGYILHAK